MDKPYRPKGSMCAGCTKATSNCSMLKFNEMPVLQKTDYAIIVRCTEYKKAK